MKKENKISDKDYDFLCHEPKSLNTHKKHLSEYYEIGTSSFISDHDNQKNLGKTFNLESIDKEKNILTYKNEKEEKIKINPMQQIKSKLSISIFDKT